MNKKLGVILIIVGVMLLASVCFLGISWARERNKGATTAQIQSIVMTVQQAGGQVLQLGNGELMIYEPSQVYTVVWQDAKDRHISLFVDGILFADRQVALEQKPSATPTPAP